ncbi:MAG: LysM peptidoglycan-binding domain-containing protein [Bacteroidota bacterium]
MKRFLVFILMTSTSFLLSAQAPYYMLFNTNCMDQLEYKFTYLGTVQNTYSVKASANEQFLLNAANEGILSPTLPKDAANCRQMSMSQELLDMINNHTRSVYMVHQRQQGDYLLMPIISATHVVRNGAFYMFTAANFSFALDTTHLVNETNLATGKSQSNVYFTGMKFRDCRIEYSFRREPTKPKGERADFEFIPGIGISSERSGLNATEAETNHVRLLKVDGLALDDYISTGCGNRPSQAGSTISPYTPAVDYGNTQPYGPTPYKEPNKEDYAIQNKKQPQQAGGAGTGFADCPEQPGKGYHIVQSGDNLKAIARTYGKNEADLIKWNQIKNPNRIEICQKIWLQKPIPAQKSNVVSKGETAVKTTAKPLQSNTRKVVDQSQYWNNKNGTPNPSQYSTNTAAPTPEYYGPANKTTTVTTPVPAVAPVQPTIHKVVSGDYLYKIAKKYGCAEECIRRANKFPLEGDIMLWPGQELVIPECTCTIPSGAAKPSAPAPAKTQPVAPTNTDNYPQQYNTTPETGAKPQPANTGSNFIEKPQSTDSAKDDSGSYFTEHIVAVGETLNSIAYRYRVSAAELAQLNGISPTEQLIAGKRLLIPHKN